MLFPLPRLDTVLWPRNRYNPSQEKDAVSGDFKTNFFTEKFSVKSVRFTSSSLLNVLAPLGREIVNILLNSLQKRFWWLFQGTD